ncbi:uncharacterized protein LOC133742246 [Rosa rugosa]|uniref:uncharacterized protein LOC133742246 n=1 Tax=Rosa rugosa TaxID=74645 RepID=UPI002B4004CE|nr:uncharacterized protein LOC133742246 [Rosa rugosa]
MFSGELECLLDSGTTHTILRHKQLFLWMTPSRSSVTTMAGPSQLIHGGGPAQFLLPNGTNINIAEALYAPRAGRTLLSFKDIRANDFHVETHCENGQEFLCITSNNYGSTRVLEKLMCRSSGLYATTIRVIESNHVMNENLWDSKTYRLWHDRLGHPGRDMMLRILKTLHGHPFFKTKRSTNQRLVQRVTSCGPFRYFMVLVDASTRWSHVMLLSTRNAAFAKLLAQIIKLRAHHPDHPIKTMLALESLHQKLLMIIACPLGSRLNTLSLMYTPKMVSQKLPLKDFKWLLEHWLCAPISLFLLGAMQYCTQLCLFV